MMNIIEAIQKNDIELMNQLLDSTDTTVVNAIRDPVLMSLLHKMFETNRSKTPYKEIAIKLLKSSHPVIRSDLNQALEYLLSMPASYQKNMITHDADIICALLDRGADINTQNQTGDTAFHLAVMYGSLKMVTYLLGKGVDINIKNEQRGYSIWYMALCCEQLDIINVLLDKSVDINKQNKNGNTALHLAVKAGNAEMVKHLLTKNVSTNLCNQLGHTALYLAICNKTRNNQTDIVDMLLEHGADINMQNQVGETALHLTAGSDNLNATRILLNLGADVHIQDEDGNTALHRAARSYATDIVGLLLDQNVDINIKNKSGKTALYIAVIHGHTDIAKYLLNQGADMHIQDSDGNTALHLAVQHNQAHMVNTLLEKGANINIKNNSGKTALQYATPEIRKALQNHTKPIEALLKKGESLAPTALEKGKPLIINLLSSSLNEGDMLSASNILKTCKAQHPTLVNEVTQKLSDFYFNKKPGFLQNLRNKTSDLFHPKRTKAREKARMGDLETTTDQFHAYTNMALYLVQLTPSDTTVSSRLMNLCIEKNKLFLEGVLLPASVSTTDAPPLLNPSQPSTPPPKDAKDAELTSAPPLDAPLDAPRNRR